MAVRHLGVYRDVSPEQARPDKRILKTLFRRGPMVEGTLAPYCQLKVGGEEFVGALARLEQWRMVEFRKATYSTTRQVCLAPDGLFWAEELVSAAQMAGEPQD